MPIILGLKDIQWKESESAIQICIPLKSVTKKDITVLSSSRYLKVSYPPFFWEAFLKGSIDPKCSETRIEDDKVNLFIIKETDGWWNELLDPLADDKVKCQELRSQAMKEITNTIKEDESAKMKEKGEKKTFTVKEQMRLDSEQRKRIESLKEAERKKLTVEVEEWVEGKACLEFYKENKVESSKKLTNKSCDESSDTKESQVSIDSNNQVIARNSIQEPELFKEKASTKITTPSCRQPLSVLNQKSKKVIFDSIPKPRTAGHIPIMFSPRVFPTASRESQKAEEEKWLQHQAEAHHAMELDCADLKPEERNPQWLKDKGDQFYAKGNHLAAVNAYNLAIRMCPKMYSLYSNRSACHLQLRNLHKCIEDASKALELLDPPVEGNAPARLKCYVRRGTAFCQLELYIEGLQDYEAAHRLSPNDSELMSDIENIRSLVQNSTS